MVSGRVDDADVERPHGRRPLTEGGRLFAIGALIFGGLPMLIGLTRPWGVVRLKDKDGLTAEWILVWPRDIPSLAVVLAACFAIVVLSAMLVLSKRPLRIRAAGAAGLMVAGSVSWLVFRAVDLVAYRPDLYAGRPTCGDAVYQSCREMMTGGRTGSYLAIGYAAVGGFVAAFLGAVALMRVGWRPQPETKLPTAETPGQTVRRPGAGSPASEDGSIDSATVGSFATTGPSRHPGDPVTDVRIALGLGTAVGIILLVLLIVLILMILALTHMSEPL